jgi:hypothetical protein
VTAPHTDAPKPREPPNVTDIIAAIAGIALAKAVASRV